MAGAFLEAADLGRGITDRAAHLPGDFARDVVPGGDHGIDGAGADLGPLGDGHVAPHLAGAHGPGQGLGDVLGGRIGTFHVDAAVDGRDGFQFAGHVTGLSGEVKPQVEGVEIAQPPSGIEVRRRPVENQRHALFGDAAVGAERHV